MPIKKVDPVLPSWAVTLPFNRHDALGHVDWISDGGRPNRATLHADGKWSATRVELAELLDAYFPVEESAASEFGMGSLRAWASETGGKVILAHPDLALPSSPGDDDEEGRTHLDG